MISTIMSPDRKWVFHFSSFVKNDTILQLKKEGESISFSIPFDAEKTLLIELIGFTTVNLLEGKYSIIDQGTIRFSNRVMFQVLKKDQLFRGTPEGAFSNFTWTIERLDK